MSQVSRRALIRCHPDTGQIDACAVCGFPVELVKNDSENPDEWHLACHCDFMPPVRMPQWCRVDSWNFKRWIKEFLKGYRWLTVCE
jgi:hypothetical protein